VQNWAEIRETNWVTVSILFRWFPFAGESNAEISSNFVDYHQDESSGKKSRGLKSKPGAVQHDVLKPVTCSEIRDWGGTVSFKAKFASVWIAWRNINSPLNWLLAEWLLLMLSILYHHFSHTQGTDAILDLKKDKIQEGPTHVTYLLFVKRLY